MGAYRIRGLQLKGDENKIPIYEDYFKFANYAKEYVEKKVVKEPMKWKGSMSSTHDITVEGIDYKGVTFILDPLYFKTK